MPDTLPALKYLKHELGPDFTKFYLNECSDQDKEDLKEWAVEEQAVLADEARR